MIIKYLEDQNFYVVKTIVSNKKGVPDLLVCIRGTFVGIEVKTPKGTATPLQEWNLESIRKAGGYSFIARSVEDVAYFISQMGGHE